MDNNATNKSICHYYDLFYRDNEAVSTVWFYFHCPVSLNDIKTEVQKCLLMCLTLGTNPDRRNFLVK